MNEHADMRSFYNTTLKEERHPYEQERWFSSPAREAGYRMTKNAIHTYVLPLVTKDTKVLEVGAGPGTWTRELLENESSISVDIVDISDEMLAQAKEGLKKYSQVTYTRADFTTFEPKKQYDVFFSSRAIEYMPDKTRMAKTISALLKKGGMGAIITKYPHYGRAKLQGKETRAVHELQVEPGELIQHLEKEGCRVERLEPVTFVFPKLQNARFDTALAKICRHLPLALVSPVVESYLLIFKKQ